MKEKEIEQNILMPLLKGRTVREAELLLNEALKIIKHQSTID